MELRQIIISAFVSKINSEFPKSEFKAIEKETKDGISVTFEMSPNAFKRYYKLSDSANDSTKAKRVSFNSLFDIDGKTNIIHPESDYYKSLLNYSDDFFKLCKLGLYPKFESGANASTVVFKENDKIIKIAFPIDREPATLESAFTKAVLNTDFGIFQAPESSFTELVEIRKGIKKELVEKVSTYKIFKGKIFIDNIELNQYQGEISDAFYEHLSQLPEFAQYQ